MPPIHADVVKRSIPRNVRRRSKDLSEKAREFNLGHLAAAHRKLAMVDAPQAARAMLLDWSGAPQPERQGEGQKAAIEAAACGRYD
jgi:hypothetical protein